MSSEEPPSAPERARPEQDPEHTGPLPPPGPGSDDAAVDGVDEFLGRPVALVSLPPAAGDELASRVEQVRQLARLHHPGLPEVFDVDGLAEDTESTLVLESLPGEPLADLLERGPLPARRVADLGVALGSALAHAHAHGVRHGAIGPASVLVDDAGAARLVGLTARLRPEGAPGPGEPVAPGDDVCALARTLAAALDPADPLSGPVTEVLAGFDTATDTTTNTGTDAAPSPAAALADRLATLTSDADGPDGAGGARFTAGALGVAGALGAAAAAGAGAAATRGAVPDAVTTTTAGATTVTLGPAGAASAAATTPPRRSRAPRRAGAAVLAAAVASLALASGVVLWNGVGFDRVESAQVPPAASAPAIPPAGPPITTSDGADGADSADSADDGTRAARDTDTTTRRGTARETTPRTRTTESDPRPVLPAPPPSATPPLTTTTPQPTTTTTPPSGTTTTPTSTTSTTTTTTETTTPDAVTPETRAPAALASGP